MPISGKAIINAVNKQAQQQKFFFFFLFFLFVLEENKSITFLFHIFLGCKNFSLEMDGYARLSLSFVIEQLKSNFKHILKI
jgi:hypothetical protein